jgi:glucose dehydrogenase
MALLGRRSRRYAVLALQQINRTHVSKLKTAWTYHTGEVQPGASGKRPSSSAAFEAARLVITRNVLFQPIEPRDGPPSGRPYQQPPWGALSAGDVNTAEIGCKVPLGGVDALKMDAGCAKSLTRPSGQITKRLGSLANHTKMQVARLQLSKVN